MVVSVGTTIRITGTKDVLTKAGNIRREPQKALRQAAIARADKSLDRFRSELSQEYHSQWATGEIARSMKARVRNTPGGVTVQFTARGGARDHLQYITAAAPGGFDKFPVRPFKMKPVYYSYLSIRFPGQARRFIQDPTTGRMKGAQQSSIRAKQVLWGSKSGGFKRDVIVEVAQSEGQAFINDVMAAFAESLQSITK